MKALILSAWEDTGGVGIALKRALELYTNWTARFVHRHHNYIGYPDDIYWEPGAPKPSGLDDLFREADVIHVVERWSAVEPFAGWRDKPLVMHHHGTEFRVDRTEHLKRTVKEYGAYAIVSTPDLLLTDPTCEWLPNPCNRAMMQSIRRATYYASPMKVIAHSPTYRPLKATELFLEATKGTPFVADVIEWQPWHECLRRKAGADLFFDQLFIGYALSGIEAMAMGIPVIGGAQDPRILELMRGRFGELPFHLADASNLRERICELADPVLAQQVAERGRDHVAKWHDEAVVATQLVSIYEKAMAMR